MVTGKVVDGQPQRKVVEEEEREGKMGREYEAAQLASRRHLIVGAPSWARQEKKTTLVGITLDRASISL